MITKYIKRPYQTNFAVITDSKRLIDSLCLQHGKYISDIQSRDDCYGITIITSGDSYIIQHGGGELRSNAPLQEIDNILFERTKYEDSVLALHGAALEYNGMAYVFLAATMSGKTTLTSYLSSYGFGYITDDCVLIDRRSFEVYPYSRPIALRDGGLEVLKRYGAEPPNISLLDGITFKRYIYTPMNCVTDSLPLARIYFISRSETENRIANMTASESVVELMKSPITEYTLSGDYIRLISKLARTGCERLYYKDMDYVEKIITKGK